MINFKALATAALLAATTLTATPAMANIADAYNGQQATEAQAQDQCLNLFRTAEFKQRINTTTVGYSIERGGRIQAVTFTNGRYCQIETGTLWNNGGVLNQESKKDYRGNVTLYTVEGNELVEYIQYEGGNIGRTVIGVNYF